MILSTHLYVYIYTIYIYIFLSFDDESSLVTRFESFQARGLEIREHGGSLDTGRYKSPMVAYQPWLKTNITDSSTVTILEVVPIHLKICVDDVYLRIISDNSI